MIAKGVTRPSVKRAKLGVSEHFHDMVTILNLGHSVVEGNFMQSQTSL